MSLSPNNTVVIAGSAGTITDSAGNLWSISGLNAVLEGGKPASFSANVAELAYVNGTVWHKNASNDWYLWMGIGWASGLNPLPIPALTSLRTRTPSPSNTVVLAGSYNAITDAAGNWWTISSNDAVLEDGRAVGLTANVAEIAYFHGTIWHKNVSNSWYSWTGTQWIAGADPLPISPPPQLPSSSSSVVLADLNGVIADAAGNLWTVSSGGAVLANGKAVGFTANVIEIANVNGTIWHENTSNAWYSLVGTTWVYGLNPLTLGSLIPPTLTTPIVATRMTFNDEFNAFSASPDGSSGTWMTAYPYEGEASRTLPDNNELEYYSDPTVGEDPFTLGKGILSINATPAALSSNPYELPYNSGLITTAKSFAQLYGYFEVNAELPSGQGLWPAFWMLPASNLYTAELDIFEAVNTQNTAIYSTTHGTIAGVWGGLSQKFAVADTSTGFHTYGVDWEPTACTFYVDGVEVGSAPTPTSMNTPMFMLLNLGVGGAGSWPGAPDATTTFPASLQINWVRAYATAGTRSVSGGAAIPVTPIRPVALAQTPSLNNTAVTANSKATISVVNPTTSSARIIDATEVQSTGDHGEIFNLVAPGVAKVSLGNFPEMLTFTAMTSVSLIGGAASVTVVAGGGANSFTAGLGRLNVTGGAGADKYIYHHGDELLTIQDFSATKGDSLTIDAALKASLVTSSDGQGGVRLSFGSFGAGVDLKAVATLSAANITWV